nr:MAG TPA: hypothetical protein [Microviridae sp.]
MFVLVALAVSKTILFPPRSGGKFFYIFINIS